VTALILCLLLLAAVLVQDEVQQYLTRPGRGQGGAA
jgi:hypothetical protein